MCLRFRPAILLLVLLVGSFVGETRGVFGGPISTSVQRAEKVDGRETAWVKRGDRQLGRLRRATRADTILPNGIALGGLILNETFSVVGNDFFQAFEEYWVEPEGISFSYTVSVGEEPAPRFGSRVVVEVGSTVLFRAFLRPNSRQTKTAARRAARRVRLYVQKVYEPREQY